MAFRLKTLSASLLAVLLPVFPAVSSVWRAGGLPVVSGVQDDGTIVVGEGVEAVFDGIADTGDRSLLHSVESHLIRIEKGGSLVLRNLTITGSGVPLSEGRLAAILNMGSLICSNVLFTSISSPLGAGGAYQDLPGSRARFFGCSFIGNSAAEGGAMFSEGGDVSCVNCTFARNRSLTGDGTRGGSAVVAIDDAKLRFADCTITENETTSADGAALWFFCSGGEFRNSIVSGNGTNGSELRTVIATSPSYVVPSMGGGDASWTRDNVCIGDDFYGGSVVRNSDNYPVSVTCPFLGAFRSTIFGGVNHTWYPPVGDAKRNGVLLYANADSSEFRSSSSAGYYPIDVDIFACPAVANYLGSRRYNALQALIDATPPGEECIVPADVYDTAVVGADKTGISIKGTGAASCVVNGENTDICLKILAFDVFVSGMTFRNGASDNGGGIKSESTLNTVVSNCTFYADAASANGGGVSGVSALYDSLFTDCSARINGGGAVDVADVRGCSFANCVAGYNGGGLYGALSVADTVFEYCSATNVGAVGGGAYGSADLQGVFTSCTFRECSAKDGGGLANVAAANKCIFTKNSADQTGGGAYSVTSIADSTFNRNAANSGGGAAYCTSISDSSFDSNSAEVSGGGTYACNSVKYSKYASNASLGYGGGAAGNGSLEGCVLSGNASKSGGGVDGVTQVIGSLFWKNSASETGGAGAGSTTYRNCTFAYNTVGGVNVETNSALAAGTCYDSLFTNNELPKLGIDAASKKIVSSYFFDASNGDFHLHPGKNQSLYVGSNAGRGMALSNSWTDPDKCGLVTQYDGSTYFYLGAYAFAGVKLGGTVVTGPDDNYANSNLRTSLREAVENAIANSSNRGADGKYVITFSDKLFDSTGVATIKFDQSGVIVDAYTNGALVVRGPADKTIVLDGDKRYRPFQVNDGNELELENLTFENCFGAPYALRGNPPPADGGCVLNRGSLKATNCAFRDSQAGHRLVSGGGAGSPEGHGGAICNAAGSTAVVVRCSFANCRAVRGGAVYDENGSRTSYAHSTFCGNAATGADGVGVASGGAIYVAGNSPDAVFINCTVAGNACTDDHGVGAGGGVCLEGYSGNTTCRFVNSIIVGNSASGAADLEALGQMDLHYTWYGERNAGLDNRWSDHSSEGGKGVADFFADISTEGGVKARTTTRGVGPVHSYLPLVASCAAHGALVRAAGDYSTVATANGTAPKSDIVLVRGASAIQARMNPIDRLDQLGVASATDADSAHMGAVYATAERTVDPVDPPQTEDPLAVTDASAAALRAAIVYANGNPAAASEDGRVTVHVAEGAVDATFSFADVDCNIPITGFTDRTLVIKGPMTIDLQNLGRFLDVFGGNRVELYDLTIINGRVGSSQGGGAICVDSGEDGKLAAYLYCSNCTFSACTAGMATGWGYGGAVSQEGVESSLVFEKCTFSSNSSSDGLGDSIYREGTLELLDCTLAITDVYAAPLYAVVKGETGAISYFDAAEDALLQLEALKGDVLVLLSDDCKHADEIVVPTGVEIVTMAIDELQTSSMSLAFSFPASVPAEGAVITKACGLVAVFSSAEEASSTLASFAVGDSVTLGASAPASSVESVRQAAVAAVSSVDWYSVKKDGNTVSAELNEKATPVIEGILTEEGVVVVPANVKPFLWYGLGWSQTIDGEYQVEPGSWVQADASGMLPSPLTAPRHDPGAFYKIFTRSGK